MKNYQQTLRALTSWAKEHNINEPVFVGFSGGADSTILLHAANQVFNDVTAVIINHQLQECSGQVTAEAVNHAQQLGVKVLAHKVEVGTEGGMENAARNARYEAFSALTGDSPVLLGHHLNDQAETVLLGLARGSSAASMRGMKSWNGKYGRPLLTVPRTVIEGAVEELGLNVYRDEQNEDTAFTRVSVRKNILPLMEESLPGVVPHLAQAAQLLGDDDDFITGMARTVLDRVQHDGELHLHELTETERHPALLGRMLRLWLHDTSMNYRSISSSVNLILVGHAGKVAVGGDGNHRLFIELVRNKNTGAKTLRRMKVEY